MLFFHCHRLCRFSCVSKHLSMLSRALCLFRWNLIWLIFARFLPKIKRLFSCVFQHFYFCRVDATRNVLGRLKGANSPWLVKHFVSSVFSNYLPDFSINFLLLRKFSDMKVHEKTRLCLYTKTSPLFRRRSFVIPIGINGVILFSANLLSSKYRNVDISWWM